MLIEAALLPRNLLNEGNQIHNFCDSILLQKVPVPTIPVPKHCYNYIERLESFNLIRYPATLLLSTGTIPCHLSSKDTTCDT
jgi:hypothetical protein